MVAVLAERVARRGDEVALIDEFDQFTWSELDERQNRLVHALRGLGLGVGDTVAMLGGNRHEWVETLFASGSAGLVSVPINWHLSPDEIAYILENSGAAALVADAEYADSAKAAAEQSGVDVRISFGGPIDGFTDFEELVAAGDPSEPEDQVSGATMFYTSGTTGRPKGVKSSLQTVGGDPVAAIQQLNGLMAIFKHPAEGVVLCNAPAYHAGPLAACLVPFMIGARMVMRRKWDAAETLQLIDEHEVTGFYAVPTHFTRLLRLPDETRAAFSGASLKSVLHTAAPCPPDVKRQMIDWWGPVITEAYSASEGAGTAAIATSEEWLRKPGTVGIAAPTTEILIVDDNGQLLGPGEVGQIYFRSLMGMDFEYLGDPEKTAGAHLEPGVFSFGDIGYLDEDGYLFLSDRKIDMIISGGVNIYPAEIEAVIIGHPAVVDVGVFGIPNEEYGEEVKAAVELIAGSDEDAIEAELRALCRERLAGYMIPRSFDFGELPRTPTGKLPKRELRARYWEGTGRTI